MLKKVRTSGNLLGEADIPIQRHVSDSSQNNRVSNEWQIGSPSKPDLLPTPLSCKQNSMDKTLH